MTASFVHIILSFIIFCVIFPSIQHPFRVPPPLLCATSRHHSWNSLHSANSKRSAANKNAKQNVLLCPLCLELTLANSQNCEINLLNSVFWHIDHVTWTMFCGANLPTKGQWPSLSSLWIITACEVVMVHCPNMCVLKWCENSWSESHVSSWVDMSSC